MISSLVSADPMVIAHRGFSSVAPENTMAAVHKALELSPQPQYIEIDLYRSQDGVLVISHDENTLRTTGVAGILRETPFETLRQLDAGYATNFGEQFKGEKIPTLEEILDAVKDTPVGIMIECKQLLLEDEVITLLRKRNEVGKHVIASFDELTIFRAKKIEPKVKTLYLTGTLSPEIYWRAHDLKADIIGTNMGAKPADVKTAQEKGYTVWVWTVDEADKMKEWAAAGVDGIISNKPDLVIEVTQKK